MKKVLTKTKLKGECSETDAGDQSEEGSSSAPEGGMTGAVLIEVSGQDQGRICRLAKTHTSLGRGGRRSIRVRDRAVSRYHARIVHFMEGYVFEDVKSLNGSFINHERVDRVILKHGDIIQLGPNYGALFMLLSPEEAERLLSVSRMKNPSAEAGRPEGDCDDDGITTKIPERGQRSGRGNCCLAINIDHLGLITSTYGSRAGEEVLDQLSDILVQWIPQTGTITRCPDGRLLVTLPGLAFSSASALAEKYRLAVQRSSIIAADQSTMCTVSVAVLDIEKGGIIAKDSNLLQTAGEMLEKAKAAGGNMVVTSA
jgi:diguanylate cyclase (GGDEF)-like protein